MEARFNQNNKLIGRRMMEHGGKYGYLAREQFGSRIYSPPSKMHSANATRQTKIPAVYTANDVKSCYDRIFLMVCTFVDETHGHTKTRSDFEHRDLGQMPRTVLTNSLMRYHMALVKETDIDPLYGQVSAPLCSKTYDKESTAYTFSPQSQKKN